MSTEFKNILTKRQLTELFESDEKCLELLARIKWSEGYACRRCGNVHYCPGKTPYSRRCTRCKSDESATRGTIFHNCKFPIHKAFYIAYHVCQSDDKLSTYEFARKLSLRQMTCWNFRTKIQQAMQKMNAMSEQEKKSILTLLTG